MTILFIITALLLLFVLTQWVRSIAHRKQQTQDLQAAWKNVEEWMDAASAKDEQIEQLTVQINEDTAIMAEAAVALKEKSADLEMARRALLVQVWRQDREDFPPLRLVQM